MHPEALLPDYALGLLSHEERVTVEAHLEACEQCQRALERYQQGLNKLVEALPEKTPPPDLWSKIEAQLPSKALAEPRVLPKTGMQQAALPYRWLVAACIALLASTTGGLLWGYSNYQNVRQVRAETQLINQFLTRDNVERVSVESTEGGLLGSLLRAANGETLVVLSDPPPGNTAYQAWGHNDDNWDPDKGERLEPLALSRSRVFPVTTAGFAALYLSVEPSGGSPQPTDPISKVALLEPAVNTLLTIEQPLDGALISSTNLIVRGLVAATVRRIEYQLDGGEALSSSVAGNRFSFTLSDLSAGDHRLELRAFDAQGVIATETIRFSR